jgi:hypothetical protein
MLAARLRGRVRSARVNGVATLSSHVLRFHKRSKKDGSAKCNAFLTSLPEDAVYGVVYDMDPTERPKLDKAEGLGQGYARLAILVTGQAGPMRAFTYMAEPAWIDDSLRPFEWYKRLVVAGAREHQLPAPYVEALEGIPAIPDPDPKRDAKKRALLVPGQ